DPQASEADLRDQIEHLERLKSAAAAAQARAAVLWDRKRRAAEAAVGVAAARRGKGLSTEVALARREAPNAGGRHLGLARALVEEMPHTLAALECGALSEWRATLIVRESACLSPQLRRQLDAELSADPSRFDGWGDARVAAEAKQIACRLDVAAVLDRSAKAEKDRRVTIRPAPDSMTKLTALLPVKHGVAVYAALHQVANTTFDDRTRGQIMADTLVERITGRPAAAPIPVNLNLVMADTTLFGDDEQPAWVAEYGPVPAELARRMVADAALDENTKAAVRRLYRHPDSGQLVAMEAKARLFPKGLAAFIGLRDQTCRTPYCNAPIRHRDHAVPHRDGGPTNATNGLGTCEACNYAKETPGWTVTTTVTTDGEHVAEYTTPTGAVYRSTAPPLPG
ncbi:HNH endonuclease, partial [Mycobacterium sp. SWH-M5]